MIQLDSIKDVARAHARAGFRILPLHGLTYDTDTGELQCACRNGADCRSPGKHPLETIARRGALDASADVEAIDRWPDNCNIGIVPSPTVAGIDIDDPELAQQILQSDLAQELTIVKTRRGIHIYVRCAPSQTQNLTAEDGHHVGEVRVDNALLVLPPSRHLEGNYQWVGRSLLDDQMPETQGTAFEWIRDMLIGFGVKLVDRNDPEMLALMPDGIEDCDLPFEVDPQVNLKLYQLLTGTYPTNDRSGIIFHLGCEIWRSAIERGLNLDPSIVAGVIRKADSVAWNKYETRTGDRDRRYWETAVRAKYAVEQEIDAKGGSAPASTAGMRTWAWDPAAGFIYQGGNTPKRVCNFEPLIVEVQNVVDETDNLVRSNWLLRFTNIDNEVWEYTLQERERGDLRRSLSAVLPPTFIVTAREWGNLEEGMRWYSKDTMRVRRLYNDTGWLSDRDAFLLPAIGAITPDGVDNTVEISNENLKATSLRLYGIGMEKPGPEFNITEALRVLYATAPAEVMVPLMMQSVAAPLASIDYGGSIGIVHMLSRTGSFKTSIARVVISLYGSFARSFTPETWTSTANSLQLMMHEYRDLPLIVDDYKRSLGKVQLSQMVALLQNYADRTTRGRMTRDQRSNRRATARCLAISTGEDVWEGQESVMARSIIIDASRYPTTLVQLRPAQEAAANGVFAKIGYLWIEHLCGIGRVELKRLLTERYTSAILRLEEDAAITAHARSRASVASLMAVDLLWTTFLTKVAPDFLEEYRAMRKSAWNALLQDVATQAEDAQLYSPYEVLRETIIGALSAGDVYLAPRTPSYTGMGRQGVPTIGYIDDEYVYLNEPITMRWYATTEHRKGGDSNVSWLSVLYEGRQHHGLTRTKITHVNHNNVKTSMRLAGFPRRSFLPDDIVIDDETGEEIDAEPAEDDIL